MVIETIQKKQTEQEIYLHRARILVNARFKDVDRTAAAVHVQDRLRKKIGCWHGAEEIKRWRTRHN